ncbi:MAG TPA: hypothetical protein VFJ71_13045 [Candidatus Limnocylindrales bacterium]|nr:hypothetical protein [Candidatus Limnocylindrales bacterium]
MTDPPPARGTTLAVGGHRHIPAPDPIAHDYLLLVLRIDQHIPGLIDGYFGPADLKARSDIEELRPAPRLVDDAAALLERIASEEPEADRRRWLTAQTIALRTHAEALAGHPLPYLDHVERCFEWRPVRRDEGVFEDAAAEIDRLLPGTEPLAARLAAWDRQFTIPPDRVLPVATWLVERFRERAATTFGLPEGEQLRIRIVSKQPWTGYNWFDGARGSRVDINADLPARAAELVHVAAHESYPGHHLEHAWKEAELVDRRGRLEASVLTINTPECLISEGLADLGHRFASPAAEEADLLVEVYDRAGLEVADDPAAARAAAETSVALAGPRRRLTESRVNAALMRHEDGLDHETVLAWLERVGRYAPDVAAKRLEFIEHPLWRTYVFVYHEGEALLRRWLEAVPPEDQPARFGRLLREQLTPTAVADEMPGSVSSSS